MSLLCELGVSWVWTPPCRDAWSISGEGSGGLGPSHGEAY